MDTPQTVELLSLLYELSLTNLHHQNPKETAEKFIKKLLSRKSLTFGAAWKINGGNQNTLGLQRIYSMPEAPEETELPIKVYKKYLDHQPLIVLDHSIISPIDTAGRFAYFKLGDFGILELYDGRESNNQLSDSALAPYLDVIKQFANSLQSGFWYELIQEVMAMKDEAEKSLRANEEKYRRIIDNIQLGLMEVDNDEIIQFANKSLLNFLEYDLEEMVGQNASDLLVAEEEKDILAKENQKRQAGVSSSYEVSIRSKSGKKKWAVISGAPNYDRSGAIIGSIGIHMDITEQKLLRKENEFKNQQLKKLFDQSLDALVSIDQQGLIFEWSPQAEKIFGYKAAEVINKPLSDTIIPKQYREAHTAGMKKYLETGEGPVLNSRIEITAVRKTDEEFPIELTIFPLEHGDKKYFTAFIRDITEIKKAKESMENALKQQQELNNLKSQFVAMTSHELRTPLTTIKANLELVNHQIGQQDGPNPEKIKTNIDRISHNADRLNQLIGNILLIGQLESKKIPFRPEPIFPHEFISNEVLDDYHSQNLPVANEVVGTPQLLPMDKTLFHHVMTNLLDNAIKYSEDAQIPEVSTVYHKKSVEVAVQDHGVGIPQEDQDKLFGSFFRGSNVGNVKGTGLGLAIVEEFVKLHGGAVKVQSKVGQGTTFTLYFPMENK